MARANKAEVSTSDIPLGQSSPIILPEEGGIERGEVIPAIDTPEAEGYLDTLAFMEEPVTIRLEPSADKNAPKHIECWVNGVGAEVMKDGKWVKLGFFPVGVVLTTKRKYIEVLARSKVEQFNTPDEDGVSNPRNVLERQNYSRAPFTVIRDDNPKGIDWLTKLLSRTW